MINMRVKKTPLIRLVIDLFIFLLAAVPLLVVHIVVKPFEFGFFCGDQAISHPYKEDSMPMSLCAILGVILSAGSFIVIEFSCSLGCHKTRDTRLFNVLWTVAKLVLVFSFGMCVNLVLTETAKLGAGQLRPNFFNVCKPNMTNIDCSQGYIQDFVCTNKDLPKKIILDSRKSFPSGHSSFVTFVAVFIGYYYQRRLVTEYTVLLRPYLQMLLGVLAVYTSVSRVTDFKHHWTDVYGGSVLGALVAFWTLLCLGRYLDLELGPFLAKRPTSPTLDTHEVPMSDPCTPEPATFNAAHYEPPAFSLNHQGAGGKRDPV